MEKRNKRDKTLNEIKKYCRCKRNNFYVCGIEFCFWWFPHNNVYHFKFLMSHPSLVLSLTSPSSQSSRSGASQAVSSSSHCTSSGAQPQVSLFSLWSFAAGWWIFPLHVIYYIIILLSSYKNCMNIFLY